MGGTRGSGSSRGMATVTSNLPRGVFQYPDKDFSELGAWATSVGAVSANITDYGRADITLRNGTVRKARIQPGSSWSAQWVFLEDYLSG